MTPFEFVTVLISIILGLGITQIMSGVADLIHQWDKVKLYWPHLLWVVLVFILHVQQWWLLWALREMVTWTLPFFLFEILYPINLFILARILFPAQGDEAGNDLKVFYYKNYRKFFLMVIILSALSAIENVLLASVYKLGSEAWLVPVLLLVSLAIIALRKISNPRVHEVFALILLISMSVSIVVNINEWLVR